MHLPFGSSQQVIEDLVAHSGDRQGPLWLLLVAERHGPQIPGLIEAARAHRLRLAGGLFPGLIHGARVLEQGLIAVPLPSGSHVAVADLSAKVDWRIEPGLAMSSRRTSAVVLIDAMAAARATSELLEDLFDRYAHHVSHVGGGAGYADLRHEPVLFTERGLVPQGALVVQVPRAMAVQVRHGWRRVSGPFVASRTRGHHILEINWEPAGAFYRRQLARLCADDGRPADFDTLRLGHPLCLGKDGGEDVIRDPMAVNADDEIVMLSAVPENSVMYLAGTTAEDLVRAAGEAAGACAADAAASPQGLGATLVFDCFTRRGLLQDDFSLELQALQSAFDPTSQRPVQGVLAMGEVAASADWPIEFFNKTVVVANLGGDADGRP